MEKLKTWQLSLGLTNERAAEFLNVSASYYKDMRYGKTRIPKWIRKVIDDPTKAV